jgi:4-hydroxy-tetrahydrodipicolinate synthase
MVIKFGKLLTAMVTPFDENLEVDYQRAQELAVRLIESGSDGVVVAGTTGESPTLTKKEKIGLFKAVVEAIGGKAVVIAGTGSCNTTESVELTKEAEQVGVDGVMLVAPYYNRPSQEGLYRHFKAIASVTSLPVIIYNIPGRTGVNVAPETLLRLTELENIIAIKEASGNLTQVSQIFEILPKQRLIYCGDDLLTLPVLSVGGAGVISVTAHIAGRKIREMITAFEHGELGIAARINAELGPLNRALFLTTNPIMVKAACNLIGLKTGGLRLPLVEASPQEITIMREVLSTMGVF